MGSVLSARKHVKRIASNRIKNGELWGRPDPPETLNTLLGSGGIANSAAFVFLEGVAAVDDQDLSGDVGSFGRGQEANRSGDFVGSACAA